LAFDDAANTRRPRPFGADTSRWNARLGTSQLTLAETDESDGVSVGQFVDRTLKSDLARDLIRH
jgi:hypothetical protein